MSETKTMAFRIFEGSSPTLNETVPNGGYIMMESLSYPLQQLVVEAREQQIVVCPARLDNKVLLEAIKPPAMSVLFLYPILRVCGASKSKLLEGSLILYIYTINPHFTPTIYGETFVFTVILDGS